MADRRDARKYALGERDHLNREDLLTAALLVLPFAFLLILILAKL
jgi:hypothetical protein